MAIRCFVAVELSIFSANLSKACGLLSDTLLNVLCLQVQDRGTQGTQGTQATGLEAAGTQALGLEATGTQAPGLEAAGTSGATHDASNLSGLDLESPSFSFILSHLGDTSAHQSTPAAAELQLPDANQHQTENDTARDGVTGLDMSGF